MDPKSTAVVLIEYQNDFTSEGGTLHQAVKPVMDKANMLANTIETVGVLIGSQERQGGRNEVVRLRGCLKETDENRPR
jgi:nicotinamidase-related amidase